MVELLQSNVVSEKTRLTHVEKRTVEKFNGLKYTKNMAVREFRGELNANDVDSFITRLEEMKTLNPDVYQQCMDKLKSAVDGVCPS